MTDDSLVIGAYDYKDPTNKIAILPNVTGLKALEEITGNGSGGFTISLNDKNLVGTPEAGYYRTIYKLSCGGKVVSGFVLQNRSHSLIDSAEQASEYMTVSGDGLKSLLADIVVYPVTGKINPKSAEDRVFSWASPRGIWYDSSQWKVPTKVEQYGMLKSSPNKYWKYQPAEWPDAPNAWWVWSQAPKNNVTPAGDFFLRTEFTVSNADAGTSYSLFIAGDNQYQAFIDGALAVEATGSGNYFAKVERYDTELEAGTHILAIRGRQNSAKNKAGAGPAGIIAVLFKAGDAEAGTAAQIIRQTGGGNWRSLGYPKTEPGWTAGEVLIQLLKEGAARGVRAAKWIKPNFTESADSNGVAWANRLPYSFSVGTSLLDVIEQMETLEVEAWVDPDTMQLNVAQNRGVDRTVQPPELEAKAKAALDAFVQASGKSGFTVKMQKTAPAVDPKGIWINTVTYKPYFGVNNLGSGKRQNDVINPTFSSSVNNWRVMDDRDDFVQSSGRGKFVARYAHDSGTIFVRTAALPASAGATKSASLVLTNSTTSTRQFRLQLSAYNTVDASNPSIANTSISNTSFAPGETKTLTVSGFTLPSGTKSYTLAVLTSGTDTTLTNGNVIYLDNVLAETAATPGVYFSGSTPGAKWTGIANGSTSTYPGPNWFAFTNANTIAAAKKAVTAAKDYQAALKAPAVVKLMEGWNLTRAGTTGEADLTNKMLMKTDDGWIVTQDDTSVNKYGPIEGQLTTTTNASQSKNLAKKVFSSKAEAEESSTYELIPRPGATPFVNFNIGDWVLAPNKDGNMVRRRIMSIAITPDDAGNPMYAIEFDTIFQTKEQQYDRMSKLASGSGLGAGFAFASASGGSGVGGSVSAGGSAARPSDPIAPQNLVATSTAAFSKTGEPVATVNLNWDFVSQAEDGTAIRGVLNYLVYGRLADAANSAGRLYATVNGSLSSVKISSLVSDEDYIFWVVAQVSETRVSDPSTAVAVHTAIPTSVMTPPSKPSLSTKLGTVTAKWDGKMSEGQAAPASLLYVFAEMSASSSGTYATIGNTIGTASTIVLTGLTVGQPVYVRFRARDKAGNTSNPSAVATLTVDGVNASDLGQEFQDRLDDIETVSETAQQKASDAAAAAQAAQRAAEEAAESSGGILYQEDTPDASNAGRLWVKPSTKKSYLYDESTGQWEEITDPDIAAAAKNAADALEKATQAARTAQTAAEAAGQAQTSADGKNTIWWLPNQPPVLGNKVGDTWFDTDDGNKMSLWDGNTWALKQAGENFFQDLAVTNAKIANLDAAKITTGYLAAGRIESASITSRMLAVGDFKNYLDGSNFEDPNNIPWLTIPSQYATIDGTLSYSGQRSAKFTAPSTKQAGSTVVVNLSPNPRFGAGVAAEFAQSNLGADSTTTAHLYGLTGVANPTGSTGGTGARVRAYASLTYMDARQAIPGVSAGQAYSAALSLRYSVPGATYGTLYIQWWNGDPLNGGTLLNTVNQSQTLVTGFKYQRFTITNRVAPSGTTHALIIARVGGTIVSQDYYDVGAIMFNRGTTPAAYFDGSFQNTDADTYNWNGTAERSATTWTSVADRPAVTYTYNSDIPVASGQSYYVEGYGYRNAAYDGNVRGAYIALMNPDDGSMIGRVGIGTQGLPDSNIWQDFGDAIAIPDGVTFARPVLSINHTAGTLWLDDLSIKVQAGGTLIADGSVTTNKVAANAIKANNIDAGAVTAVALSADAVTANNLQANAITSKHTITGALIRTSASGARTEMTNQGIRVLDSTGAEQVKLGYGLDTGMSVLDTAGSGKLIPIGNQLFGAKGIVRDSDERVSNGSETAWGSTTELATGLVYNSPTGRAFIMGSVMTADITSYQDYQYRFWMRLYRVSTNYMLTNTYMGYFGGLNATAWFYYADQAAVAGEDVVVRLGVQSRKTYGATGNAYIGKRTTFALPV